MCIKKFLIATRRIGPVLHIFSVARKGCDRTKNGRERSSTAANRFLERKVLNSERRVEHGGQENCHVQRRQFIVVVGEFWESFNLFV